MQYGFKNDLNEIQYLQDMDVIKLKCLQMSLSERGQAKRERGSWLTRHPT